MGLVGLSKVLELLLSFVATGSTGPAVSLDMAGTWSAENNVLKRFICYCFGVECWGGSSVPRSMRTVFI